MQRIKLIVEYDGSNYHGFQRQPNAHTIQAELERAIRLHSGESVTICAAGRTDAGVHALGQVVAFHTEATIPAAKWSLALNSSLPSDIRILESQAVSASFHPQFDALQKSYLYLVYRRHKQATFYRNHALLYEKELDIEAMQQACRFIIGKHDFHCFCASGSAVKTWERTVRICNLEQEGDWLKLKITADGFLYNMVRIVMGTLLEVGRGRFQADEITRIITSRDRRQAGPTVVAQGLYLGTVEYPV